MFLKVNLLIKFIQSWFMTLVMFDCSHL